MNYVHRIDCTRMNDEKLKSYVQEFTEDGWTFIGISDNFPPGYQWAVFSWDKDCDPKFPKSYQPHK